MLAKSKAEVGDFICDQWIADPLDPLLAEILTELEQHDWSEDGKLQYDFEIGGVSFEDVVTVTPNGAGEQSCGRCGGDGVIHLSEAGPSIWGEDCFCEEDRLIQCPTCRGEGIEK